ncbi:sodium:proton antiporter NhaD [Sodaliphilus sp.]|uniref:sodium:proton antiporter NhaD n=1 Tax=Sodaliphilus sp. TaxID=2815818 RepID=UPI00388DB09A
MSTLTILIVIVFLLGYTLIALEGITRVNKAAVALLMFVLTWTVFMVNPGLYFEGTDPCSVANGRIVHHLGETATTLFFLMGAMAVVEVVDRNGGFNFVRNMMRTRSKRSLLWRVAFLTFFLSAILDNLTTSIVMVMLLRKLVQDRKDLVKIACAIIVAANAGGAFSPIGDVTTIMLWNQGVITAGGVIKELFLPSLVAMLVPVLMLHFSLKGELDEPEVTAEDVIDELNAHQRRTVFFMGVGGLIFVPIFHSLTDLPPFMGILLVLGALWLITELFYGTARLKMRENIRNRVSRLLGRIDMSTIMFFLGILMAVGCLEEIGVLTLLGQWLDGVSGGNHYVITGLIGAISSIVDNVPLVAGCMGMYPPTPTGDMAVDGVFWQLLAYCAGVGGSLLIVGSAAGVVVMGMAKIGFGNYMKHMSLYALVGYLAGMFCYFLLRTFVF